MQHPHLAIGTIPWRAETGAFRLTVIAKATFELRHNEEALLVEPLPLWGDVHHDGDAAKSLARASDFALRKPRADVLFTGHVYAGIGERATRGTARLALVGERGTLFDKSIQIVGERRRNPITKALSQPEPFSRLPLRYELSFGGAGFTRNPVGSGVGSKDARQPSLIDAMDQRNVVSFGPIAPDWTPRSTGSAALAAAGHDGALQRVGKTFPFSFFNSAPEDQQVPYLIGDEELQWSALHPTIRELRARLPGVRVEALLGLSGTGDATPVALVADTLWIDGDELRACITWRGEHEVAEEIARGARAFEVLAKIVSTSEAPNPERVSDVGAPSDPRRPSDPGGPSMPSPARPVRAAAVAAPDVAAPLVASPSAAAVKLPAAHTELRETQHASDRKPSLPEQPAARRPLASTQVLLQPNVAPAGEPARLAAIPSARVGAEGGAFDEPASPVPVPVASAGRGAAALNQTLAAPDFDFSTVDAPATAPVVPIATAPSAPNPIAPREPSPAPIATPGFVAPARLAPVGSSAPATPARLPPAVASPKFIDRALGATQAFPVAPDAAVERLSAALPPDAPASIEGDFEPPTREGEAVPLVNITPWAACSFPFQLRPPGDARIVIVKATLSMADGELAASPVQLLPIGDVHWDDDPKASLRYASDFVPHKPKADVTLVGHAPAGAEGNVAVVGFRLGALQRRLAVFGDRSWRGIGVSEPLRFERIALRWERAMGGPISEANPVGIGFKTGVMLPNLENPEQLIRSPGATPAPSCFAPIPATWRARASKLGTYDARWVKTRWPYLPEDVDLGYFNSAPPQQQIDLPLGDERFELKGFGPKPITGKLPGLRPRAFAQQTTAAGGRFTEVRLRLDTIAFDVDAAQVVLVWRGLIEVTDEDAPEIAAIFVTSDRLRPLTLEAARAQLHGALAAQGLLAPKPELDEAPANDAGARRGLAAAYAKLGTEIKQAKADRRPAPALGAGARPRPDLAKRFGFSTLRAPPTPERVALLASLRSPTRDRTDFSGVDLADADLRGMSLEGLVLARAVLRNALLDGCNLTGAQLSEVDAEGASFAGATLVGADLTRAKLTGCKLKLADLFRCVLEGAQCVDASFDGVEGAQAVFTHASLMGASFVGARLLAADLTGAALDGASFAKADLTDARLYDCAGVDVNLEGANLSRVRANGAKLARAQLRGVQAPGSLWEGADLEGARFESADLALASFVKAHLDGATFNRADCTEARFRKASMRMVTALKANMMQANFERADLTGADLRGANLYQAETLKAKTDGMKTDQALVAGSKLEKR